MSKYDKYQQQLAELFANSNAFSRVVTAEELKNKRVKAQFDYDQERIAQANTRRVRSPRSVDNYLWISSLGNANPYAKVTQPGSYRFKHAKALKQFYDAMINKQPWEIWSNVTETMLANKEIAFRIFDNNFNEGMSLNDFLNQAIQQGSFQSGFLTVKGQQVLHTPFWSFGSLEDGEGSDAYPAFGDDTQKKFMACVRLYSFFLRYYYQEKKFKNVIDVSVTDKIEVTLDVETEELTEENRSGWRTLMDNPTWNARILVRWTSQNDEITKFLLKKSDFKIDHSMKYNVSYLNNYKTPQAPSTTNTACLFPMDSVNKLTIKTAGGSSLEFDLIKFTYDYEAVFKKFTSWRKFDPATASLYTHNGVSSTSNPVGVYIVPFVLSFIGENLHTPKLLVFNSNSTTGNRTYLYFRDYNETSQFMATMPYLQRTDADGIEVNVGPAFSAAYTSIPVNTVEGQLITNIPFQYSNHTNGDYTFTAIVDNIRYIDAVYVLGNQI